MALVDDDSQGDNVSDIISSTVQTTLASLSVAFDNTTDGLNLLIPFDKSGPRNQPNTALFCTLLTLGTFMLAYSLKIFRNSKFLGRNARRALGDFGVNTIKNSILCPVPLTQCTIFKQVPISIAIFVMLDFMLPQVFTDKLNVPDGISPSDPTRRGWLIPLGPVPMWLPFLSLIPALLVYILIFMETQISELIVGKPERGLKKGKIFFIIDWLNY